jgi:hypothetical protein
MSSWPRDATEAHVMGDRGKEGHLGLSVDTSALARSADKTDEPQLTGGRNG